MGDLQEIVLKYCDKKPLAWWQYIDDIFMLWQLGKGVIVKVVKFLYIFINHWILQ